MKMRDVVKYRPTGKVGVIVPTLNLMREDGEWSVIYDGCTDFHVVENEDDFEVIRSYNAVADLDGCNAGEGEKCCRFLGMAGATPTCLRFGEFHWDRTFAQSRAKREPHRLYPDCKQSA